MSNLLRGGDRHGARTYYDVVVAGSFVGNSGVKGTPQIGIVFAHADEPDYGITAYRYLTKGTVEYVLKDLEVLGWDAVKAAYRFEELDGEKSPIVGAKATICVEEEEYEGKLRPKVLFINPFGQTGKGGAPKEQMTPQQAKSWGDQVREALGVGPPSPRSAPARPGASTRAKPAPGPDATARQERTRQAVKDGIANQGGRHPEPAPAGGESQGEDYDFEDIPFAWVLWLLPTLGFFA